jgi:hypothetical protein
VIDYSRFGRLPTAPLAPVRLAPYGAAATMVNTALCAAMQPRRSRQINQESP